MVAPTKSREKTRVQALSQLRGVAEEVYVWQNWLWSFKRMVKPIFSMQVFIFDFHKYILLNEHYWVAVHANTSVKDKNKYLL